MDTLTKDLTLGVLRHVFTFVGGIVVLAGYFSTSIIQVFVGLLIALIGGVWSVVDKYKGEKKLKAVVLKATLQIPQQ